ncbi:chloramphenicol phosphotransferase [Kitasatospora sp. MMS16-BH015]|uniref:chloramphenicol phosphotransferase CPT family protein n=1 Tax=Kitasatospora sp. MMS16-BH015 TaxID=2018025 RepID=UPI000CA32C6A|nr:AAA family ATPase [Kitasatospora sp. MMS16-BH015]AUG75856.1 chloramphenicol phosphotransferase [Kitasatospora sp. MMS16-BH015]
MSPAAPGRIIFLNGTSSSGKSSIARELLRVLDETFFHFPVDAFHAMRADRDIPDGEIQAELDRTARGFHRAVAGMSAAGNHLVVDHVLTDPWRLRDCLDLFPADRVLLVGVHCALPELERREALRGDRPPGLAARQLLQVHAHGTYDLECDTGHQTPTDIAHRIKTALADHPAPTAFTRLKQTLPTARD